jgi:PPOX class probable F420-dependent enzyme
MATQTIERPAAELESRFAGRFISLTTFKRNGAAVVTPLLSVSDGRRLYAFTDLHSGKVKRIRRNPRILLAPCWPGGRLRGAPVEGRVEILTDAADLRRVQQLMLDRYKLMYRFVLLGYQLGRRLRGQRAYADAAALAITPE